MSSEYRPAFLDVLTNDVVLTGTLIKDRVIGPQAVIKVVETVASFYRSMVLSFRESIGNREFIEYDAELINGSVLHGLVFIVKNAEGAVSHLALNHGPIESVIWLSTEMGKVESHEFDQGIFL